MTSKPQIKKKGSRSLSRKEKIAKLEKQISELELLLPDAMPKRAGSIERQLRLLREQLRVQKIHAISKIDSIRRYTVSGCSGTGKKTN